MQGVRAELGRVVMVYCPTHRGIAGDEYADAVAQAHLGSEIEDTAEKIAARVEVRQGVTVAKSEYGPRAVHSDTQVLQASQAIHGVVGAQ